MTEFPVLFPRMRVRVNESTGYIKEKTNLLAANNKIIRFNTTYQLQHNVVATLISVAEFLTVVAAVVVNSCRRTDNDSGKWEE